MNLGLYLHVPFCRGKCDWCGFSSETVLEHREAWLQRVIRQLECPPEENACWETVFIGGGTPSLLDPDQLDRLMASFSKNLLPEAEVTVEANPESLTPEFLSVFWARGGRRLSLGIQTFDEGILTRHGRPTRRSHLEAAANFVRDWHGSLSLDLICGLVGQTEAGQRQDLDQALEWNPGHISFYSLTVEPETPLGRRVVENTVVLPEEDETVRWWLDGRDRLEKAGLHQYEVSNFARSGAECRHNHRYWSLEPWWGLGPSAVSFLPDPCCFHYLTEPSSLASWLAGTAPVREMLFPLELAKDRLLAGLRRTAGVESLPWADLLPRTRERWHGRLTEEEGRLFLTREAFPFLDSFLRDAFAELDSRPEFQ